MQAKLVKKPAGKDKIIKDHLDFINAEHKKSFEVHAEKTRATKAENERLEKLKKDLVAETNLLNGQIIEVKKEFLTENAKFSALLIKKDTLEINLVDVEKELEEKKRTLEKLRGLDEEIEKKTESLNGFISRIAIKKSESEKITKETEELKRYYSTLTDELEKGQKKLKSSIEKQTEEKKKLDLETNTLAKLSSDLVGNNNSLTKEIETKRTELKKLTSELIALEADIKEKKAVGFKELEEKEAEFDKKYQAMIEEKDKLKTFKSTVLEERKLLNVYKEKIVKIVTNLAVEQDTKELNYILVQIKAL